MAGTTWAFLYVVGPKEKRKDEELVTVKQTHQKHSLRLSLTYPAHNHTK